MRKESKEPRVVVPWVDVIMTAVLEDILWTRTHAATSDILVYMVVHGVLVEMVNDVETWAHENERNQLYVELQRCRATLAQKETSERIQWNEMQNVLTRKSTNIYMSIAYVVH